MPEEYQGNNLQLAPGRPENDGWKPLPVVMLVMGLSGCGKSSFINLATGQTDCVVSTGPRLCTKYPRSCRHSIRVNECEFRFVDTPGFSNDTINDRKVLERLIEHLAPRDASGFPKRVAGLLYIHSEDEPFKGRTSRKTIEMLVKILGEWFLDRVTVLVRSQNGTHSDLSTVQSKDSPLYPLYCHNIKPWDTILYTQDPQSIENMLTPYMPLCPRLVRLAALDSFVQRVGNNWQYNDISRHLRELFPDEIGDTLIAADQAVARIHSQEQQDELEKARNLLAQREQELEDRQSALENEVRNIREKIMAEKSDHEVRLGSLCEAIRDQGDKVSELQSKARSLLAQKDRELNDIASTHENKLNDLQEKIAAEKSDHEVHFLSLCKIIRDQEEKISELQSSMGLGVEEIESLKALGLKKDMEIKSLQEELQVKDKKLTRIEEASERAIRELMGISRVKESGGTELKSGVKILELESSGGSGAQEVESLKALGLKKDIEIKSLQEELQAKNAELTKVKEDGERALRESMEVKEKEGTELKSRANGMTNRKANKPEEEIRRLEAEIRRINADYGSLLTHMQLQENTEQADIMTALGDINRLIEEYGQTISERIEKHMEDYPSGRVLQPQDLLSIFGRVESEVASKIKQDAYLLFEYAVQATICDQLYTHLFKPFHPTIANSHDSFVMEVYDQLSHQAPQSMSGRWRKDTFNLISRVSTSKGQGKPDGERIHGLITGALGTLLGKIDGMKPEDVLKGHDRALAKLVTKAEGYNNLIKGGVSVLGDYQPIAFPFGRQFQPSHMSEVSSKPKKPVHPKTILATVGLGLIKRRASGGYQKPEEMVLCSAVVFGSPK
ncbi:unnamed protein product [Rhizoctonia solani]|uniref:G domain-containing protein n=1 Tax=Rhizoctonia solani TaxID=456999 RepID=A0A8H3DUX0_9AGAM|nr:unnamed protein product [Rhizoctonia solani]